jgi:hypothetical protein
MQKLFGESILKISSSLRAACIVKHKSNYCLMAATWKPFILEKLARKFHAPAFFSGAKRAVSKRVVCHGPEIQADCH